LASDNKTSLWFLGILGVLSIASWFRLESKAPNPQPTEPTQDNAVTNSGTGRPQNNVSSARIATDQNPAAEFQNDGSGKRRQQIAKYRKAGGAWISFGTFLAVVIYAAIARNQWQEMTRATLEATKSSETARKQLELSERPWLKVSFTVQPPGITFKDGGMQLNIVPRIENIGHSVANGVVSPMKVILADDANTMFKEPLRRQKELCDEIASKPIARRQESMEAVIFPNDFDASVGYGLSLSRADVEAAKDERIGVNLAGPKLLVPIIYGCVDYVYDTSERHHQTQFILELQQTNRVGTVPMRIPMIAIRAGQPVDASNVVIMKYPFGGFYAY
jgi:hypothetical protein